MPLPLHVHEFGSPGSPPLLALHGVTGHGARWKSFSRSQLSRYRVLAPDLRGHGRSPALPPWTLEQHAADLLAVIDGYGLDAVPVLGHSYGGLIALHLCRLAPGRISKLVLLDPAAGVSPDLALDRALLPQRTFPDRPSAWDAQRHDWPAAPDELIAEEVIEHLEHTGDGWRFRYCAPSVAAAWSEMARAPVFPADGTPTLLVRARRERYVSEAFVGGCDLLLGPDFQLVDVDAGHMLYLERPEYTGSLITDFIGLG
jgi:lipase